MAVLGWVFVVLSVAVWAAYLVAGTLGVANPGNVLLWVAIGVSAGLLPSGIVFLLLGRGAKKRGQLAERLLQVGIPANVRISGVADTGVTINDNPRVQLTLDVTLQGGHSYQVTKATTVSRLTIPRVGDIQPALVDPEDYTRLLFGPELPQTQQAYQSQQPAPTFNPPPAPNF